MTDQGSNFKNALSDFHRLPCVYHMLVIRHTLQLSDLSKTILPMKEDDVQMEQLYKIRETVSAIKNVIAFLKRSGLSEKNFDWFEAV